jgi:hypothetical protein
VIEAVFEGYGRLEVLVKAHRFHRFDHFTLFVDEHQLAFDGLVFILEFLQFPGSPVNVFNRLFGIVAVVDVQDGEEGQKEKERRVPDQPVVVQKQTLPGGSGFSFGFLFVHVQSGWF